MHRRCIAIDCRGYGDTDKPSGINAYDIDVLADDISNLAKALECDTFTLVGHDWGGMIGYQVCLRWAGTLQSFQWLNGICILNEASFDRKLFFFRAGIQRL